MRQKVKSFVLTVLLVLFLLVIGIIILFRFIPIPTSPYMILETFGDEPVSYSWVNLEDMSANLPLSVVAAEDVNFVITGGLMWLQFGPLLKTDPKGAHLQ